MIIWLASYPRSGNTLLRTVLKQCVGHSSYSDEPEQQEFGPEVARETGALRVERPWDAFYAEASASEDVFLVKTHRPPRDDQPAIYIHRDGRSALESYVHFQRAFSGLEAHSGSLQDLILGNNYYGDWSQHYKQWCENPAGRRLVLGFNDIREPDAATLAAIAAFIGHRGEVSAFDNPLRKLNRQQPDFFRTGAARWQQSGLWSAELEALFLHLHGSLMQQLGYADSEQINSATSRLDALAARVGADALLGFRQRNLWLHEAEDKERVIQGAVEPGPGDPPGPSPVRKRELGETRIESALMKMEQRLAQLENPGGPVPTPGSAENVRHQLAEKEQVIQKQNAAIHAYRLAYGPLHILARPLHLVLSLPHRLRMALGPRVGVLYQYPPQPLTHAVQAVTPLDSYPKISMVTPSFQQGHYIARTLHSVLSQNYPALQYVVQDGGSTDDTRQILAGLGDQLAGWVSEPDQGQSQAINLGFARTDGEIMCWLNSDDLLLPGALHHVAAYFNANPEVDVVYGNRIIIDESDNEVGRWVLPGHCDEALSWGDYVPQETLFWRRRAWDRIGAAIDESFQFAMDWDLLVRFRDAGLQIRHLPLFLGAFRVHASQKTSAAIEDQGFREMDRIRQRLHGEVPDRQTIHRALRPYLSRQAMTDMKYRLRRRFSRAAEVAYKPAAELQKAALE